MLLQAVAGADDGTLQEELAARIEPFVVRTTASGRRGAAR
jgi:hypothetical protein